MPQISCRIHASLLLVLPLSLVSCAEADRSHSESSHQAESGDSSSASQASSETGASTLPSAGCGRASPHALGGVQLEIDAGSAGDGQRTYFLALPPDYDPDTPHALIFGYAGTNWTGSMIRPYLGLEEDSDGRAEIFVYPDPLRRDFPGWGNLGGWVLGPHAGPAAGEGDLVFTEALIDQLMAELCVDPSRVFATGHSWGGDMAHVVSCFLGDRFAASVPVAANRPYWFEPGSGPADCVGDTAVWTFFGQDDDHFSYQDYPGQFGDECVDFWREERGCAEGSEHPLPWGADGECVTYEGCRAPVRYCLYEASAGHQVPGYYRAATMEWFRRFP